MTASRTVSILALLACTACASATEPGWRRVVGTIDIGTEYPDVLQVPDTAVAGRRFEARIVTFGSSSCTRPADAEVRQSGLTADITPYDLLAPAGSVCTDDLNAFPRAVALRFDAPGVATVRLHGRPDGSSVERRVIVVR